MQTPPHKFSVAQRAALIAALLQAGGTATSPAARSGPYMSNNQGVNGHSKPLPAVLRKGTI